MLVGTSKEPGRGRGSLFVSDQHFQMAFFLYSIRVVAVVNNLLKRNLLKRNLAQLREREG
jgi:hypothetical protein